MGKSSDTPSIGELIEQRLNRRDAMRGLLGAGAAAAFSMPATASAQAAGPSTLTFKELAHTLDDRQHVAEGYDVQVLVRWGDPMFAGAPAFDPARQVAADQEKQFGYNNDYLGLHPLPADNRRSDRFLLVVNHEYLNSNLMFAGLGAGRGANLKSSKDQVEVEMAAVGGAVLEIARENGAWTVVPGSKFARRITANTPMDISGPAAGHDLLKTSADPQGRKVLGMFGNCAGGSTPWGTWLTCEENFNIYFGGDAAKLLQPMTRRYGIGRATYAWSRHVDRFNLAKEPNESNRFGWVVEIDPYDPAAAPSDASSARAAPMRLPRTAVSRSTAATTSASSTSTNSSPPSPGTPTTVRPTRICSTTARSPWPVSMRTARWTGCRWSRARGR